MTRKMEDYSFDSPTPGVTTTRRVSNGRPKSLSNLDLEFDENATSPTAAKRSSKSGSKKPKSMKSLSRSSEHGVAAPPPESPATTLRRKSKSSKAAKKLSLSEHGVDPESLLSPPVTPGSPRRSCKNKSSKKLSLSENGPNMVESLVVSPITPGSPRRSSTKKGKKLLSVSEHGAPEIPESPITPGSPTRRSKKGSKKLSQSEHGPPTLLESPKVKRGKRSGNTTTTPKKSKSIHALTIAAASSEAEVTPKTVQDDDAAAGGVSIKKKRSGVPKKSKSFTGEVSCGSSDSNDDSIKSPIKKKIRSTNNAATTTIPKRSKSVHQAMDWNKSSSAETTDEPKQRRAIKGTRQSLLKKAKSSSNLVSDDEGELEVERKVKKGGEQDDGVYYNVMDVVDGLEKRDPNFDKRELKKGKRTSVGAVPVLTSGPEMKDFSLDALVFNDRRQSLIRVDSLTGSVFAFDDDDEDGDGNNDSKDLDPETILKMAKKKKKKLKKKAALNSEEDDYFKRPKSLSALVSRGGGDDDEDVPEPATLVGMLPVKKRTSEPIKLDDIGDIKEEKRRSRTQRLSVSDATSKSSDGNSNETEEVMKMMKRRRESKKKLEDLNKRTGQLRDFLERSGHSKFTMGSRDDDDDDARSFGSCSFHSSATNEHFFTDDRSLIPTLPTLFTSQLE